MSPIIDDPDDSHNADSHLNAIEIVLRYFSKGTHQCVFLVGDNCSVNQNLARLMGVTLVVCDSHKLNLAVRLLTSRVESDLETVQALMVKLRTLNQAAKLRFKTPLHPVLRQDIRWGSTFSMLNRYFALLEHLDRDDEGIADLLPLPAANKRLRALLEKFKTIESVSKRLQSASVSLWEARTLFDALIKDFPEFAEYLAPDASIVADPIFESAVVKVQGGRQRLLTCHERTALRPFGGQQEEGDDDKLSVAERVIKRVRRSDETAQFVLVNAIAPTSNVAERLFSRARALIGLDRHSLQPIALESLLFLKMNRSYWNAEIVHEFMTARN